MNSRLQNGPLKLALYSVGDGVRDEDNQAAVFEDLWMDMPVPSQIASKRMSKVTWTHHAQHMFCSLQSLFLTMLVTFISLWLHSFVLYMVIRWHQHLGRIIFPTFYQHL